MSGSMRTVFAPLSSLAGWIEQLAVLCEAYTEDQVPDPNGLCFSPDYKKLYVISTGKGPGDTHAGGKGDMYVFDVGSDNKLSNGKLFTQGTGPKGELLYAFDAASGELLGAHLWGAEATELVHAFAIAKTLESTEAELIETIFPHPTVSETMHEAVLDAWGKVIHI